MEATDRPANRPTDQPAREGPAAAAESEEAAGRPAGPAPEPPILAEEGPAPVAVDLAEAAFVDLAAPAAA